MTTLLGRRWRLLQRGADAARRRLSTAAAPAVSTTSWENPSKLVHPRELRFLLREFVDVEALLASSPSYAHLDADTVQDMVDAGHALAADVFEPINASGDRTSPFYDAANDVIVHAPGAVDAQTQFASNGFLGMTEPEADGGLGLPFTASCLTMAPFLCANLGLMSYHGLTNGVISLLKAHGTAEQRAEWVPKLVKGEAYGTMCLSETHAGSSLTDLRTTASPNADGSYSIKGNKMWITGGDHAFSQTIVHMVLAKLPGAPAGVKGLSLFLVPKHMADGSRNDVYVGGLNHKMGQVSSVNAGELLFGDKTGGAIGHLVGKPHQGLGCMFTMMNELRVTVGLTAAMCGVAGYVAALRYARDRPQGRPLASKDPTSPMVPIVQHSDVKRMLLQARAYAEGSMALCVYGATLVDALRTADTSTPAGEAARHEAELCLELMIPMIKSWPSEFGLEANKLAIQVHGGYGYTKDYIVEQLYRDGRVNSIYEGTTGIQSIDLLGRKVPMAKGEAMRVLVKRITADIDVAKSKPELAWAAEDLSAHLGVLGSTTATLLKCAATGDAEKFLANSNEYLTAAGHIVVAWMWLKQGIVAADALAAGSTEEEFYRGKLHTMRYFFKSELPKVRTMTDLLASLDDTNVEMKNEWFY
ncbi:acyl-CoA dehydrogenase/oxidase [Pelagophyceae sp. CCMP2097]|nr:acyl-CoA dehydrogenase/oxidase [Pelagophyceae sp. CCMP2097]